MIGLSVADIDELFTKQTNEPVIANMLDTMTQEGRDTLNELIYTCYSNDHLTTVPECRCGKLKGGWHIKRCPECGTSVSTVHEKEIESALWLALPQSVSAFINPLCWNLMHQALFTKRFSILEWLVNSDYKPKSNSAEEPVEVFNLKQYGVQRGLNYFYDNFDDIMSIIIYNGREQPKKKFILLDEFIKKYRDRIFCSYIPMPSQLLFVIEENETGRYTDKTMNSVLEGLRTIMSTSQSIRLTSIRRQNRTAKAIASIASFYESFIKNTVCGKYGLSRQHIFSARSHFSARAVISSLTEPHDHREIHIPWAMAVQLLTTHIDSVLTRRGYSPRDSTNKIEQAVLAYDKEIDDILEYLIESSPHIGIPCILQRNPTLAKASAQLMYITKIKKMGVIGYPIHGPIDITISMSVLTLIGANKDLVLL